MEKKTFFLILSSLIAIGEFIYIVFRDFFHHLPEKKKTEEKVRGKMDDPRLTKLTIEEEKNSLGGHEIIKKIFEFSEKSIKKEELEKKLEEKIKELGCLEWKLEDAWNLLEKVSGQRDKTINITENFNKIVEKINKDYEDLWSLYLETKKKHEKSSKEFAESMVNLLFIYQEIAHCKKCWNILEFLVRNDWKKFKVKKITQTS